MSCRLIEKPAIATAQKGSRAASLTRLAGCQPAESAMLADIQPLFATLDVFHDSGPHSAAMNMAIDEALLDYATMPSIRFYRWHSPALSFGYFGRFTDIAIHASERDLARRWTGGGIVLHGEDLTYSIVIPITDAIFGQSSTSIYEAVHCALCGALIANGERAEIAAETRSNTQRSTPKVFASRQLNAQLAGYSCFENPVRADVMIDGRKIAGAAQRRTCRGLLQQGSIQGVELESGFAERFAQSLSASCSECEVDGRILNRARALAESKYGTDRWLRKR